MENILSGTAAFSTRVLVFGTYMHNVLLLIVRISSVC